MRKSETKFNGGWGARRSGVHDEKYNRECHLRFILSRLKCILKGNRERRCNFPRETEHEIKRGCRTAAAHSLLLALLRSHPCSTIRLADTSRFILLFGCPRRSSTRVLKIIFPGEAQHSLSPPFFPSPAPLFSHAIPGTLYAMAPTKRSELSPALSIKDREECPTWKLRFFFFYFLQEDGKSALTEKCAIFM